MQDHIRIYFLYKLPLKKELLKNGMNIPTWL